MKHQRYNHKADIWSLGITALELAFATTPYTKLKSPMKVMMEIMDGKSPTVDSMDKSNKFSKGFKNFISKCLVKDAQKRLSATELLQTEFIKKNSKDRAFMKEKFVKFIKTIEVKECKKHDMPASLTTSRYEVKVDHDGDEAPIDDTPSNPDFTFSTSVHLEPDDLKPNSGSEADGNEEDPAKTEKKGKFMVTTISNDKDSAKKPKFTVTTVSDNNGNAVSGNNLEPTSPLATTKKPKSRFQVTQVDD